MLVRLFVELLPFFFAISALVHLIEFGVIFHQTMTRGVLRNELARANRLNDHLESQVDYFKRAEVEARDEGERYFQMCRELQYQLFLLKGGNDADYQQP